jgi:phosphodiesterase/alkaline phosphatase D-like protein
MLFKQVNNSAVEVNLGPNQLQEDHEYTFKYLAKYNEKTSKTREGKFKTFKKNADEFTFVVSSCATTMTETSAFEHISKLKPDFFVNVGDLHYSGTNRSTNEDFAFAYHEVFKS